MCSPSFIRALLLAMVIPLVQSLAAPAGDKRSTGEKPPTVIRFKGNPIIRFEMLPGNDGVNICGPSLIRAPSWLEKPLGKYYLYFAHHKGGYIRLAYADRVEGPWTVYEPGTLKLDEVVAVARTAAGENASEIKGGHIASPDVHVDGDKKEIRMYFHFKSGAITGWGHRSGVALSKDGIRFQSISTKPIGEAYLRVFRWDGYHYAIDRSAAVTRSRDGLTDFESGNPTFAEAPGYKTLRSKPGTSGATGIRHCAIKIDGNVLTVFYSRVGDLPEMLMCSKVVLSGDWKQWRLSPPVPVLEPAMDYEGGNVEPKVPMNLAVLPRPMFRELRDPAIYRENGTTYLLYSVAGERGIAGAILRD